MKKIINIMLFLGLVLIFVFWKNVDYGETRWNQSTVSYIKAEVVKILDENIENRYKDLPTGTQKIQVKILDKKYDSKIIELENNLSTTHSILLKEGSRIILFADEPEGIQPYYSVYNHDRSISLAVYLVLFILLLFVVGGKDGIMSAVVLAVSLYIILCFMVPLVYTGYSPVIVTILTCIICGIYSVILLYGYTLMALVNLISITIGFVVAAILFYIVSLTLHLNGFNLEDIEGLLLISKNTGLQIEGLLFMGVAIATYGAAKDIAASISASLLEIKRLNVNLNKKELFVSGMNIGKDIIGTMVDTLIFAFLGGSISTVFIFISYGVEFNQLINSDFFAVEIVTGLVGTAVLILMVPISAYISGIIYNLNK